jgi:FxsC-like protein
VNQNARGLQAVNAIVPALWIKIDQDRLPDVARSIQYDHADLGTRYSAEGFYGIMKLQQYRGDYHRAVHRLAQRIVDVAEETALHAEKPADYHSLPSAFGPASIKRAAVDQLHITVLAHDKSTLPEGRVNDYYGSTPHTWSPYRPDYQQPLVDYARELAKKCLGCQPVVGTFEGDAPGSAANGQLVPPGLCLVDAWVTVSPKHQQQLRYLDALDQDWVSMLVPWNSQDADMAKAERELRDGLESALANRLASVPYQCRMAATGIPTLQDFGQLLPQMTMIMVKRFRQQTPAYPPAGPPIERPRLRIANPDDSGGT